MNATASLLLGILYENWDEESNYSVKRERELLDVIEGRAHFTGVAHSVVYPVVEEDEGSAMSQEAAWDLAGVWG